MGKPVLNKCKTKFCRGKTKSKYCSKCYGRKWRERNPEKYCYHALKNNAKRRGKMFTISFEYFLEFCKQTKYLDKKGIYKDMYIIDRIDNELGYIEGNIRCITQLENSIKADNVLEDLPF